MGKSIWQKGERYDTAEKPAVFWFGAAHSVFHEILVIDRYGHIGRPNHANYYKQTRMLTVHNSPIAIVIMPVLFHVEQTFF